MNCDGVRGLLSAYLDGELSPGDLLRVEQHLRRCHCCADEVDALRQTIALVKSLDEVEVPASFRASLHERLVALGPPMPVRTVPAARTWQRHLRSWALPAAAAAAVLAVGIGQLSRTGSVEGMLVTRQANVPKPSVAVDLPPANNVGDKGIQGNSAENPANQPDAPPPTPSKDVNQTPSGGLNTPIDTLPPAPKGLPSSVRQGYAASLLDKLTRPEALPAKVATSYSLTLKADNAEETVAKLKAVYPELAPVTAVGRAGIAVRLDITVPVQQAESALANIRQLLGQNVEEEPASSADLASSIAISYKRLTDLESQRDLALSRSEEISDKEQLADIQRELEQIVALAKAERDQYQRMQDMVSTVTISVYLQK